MTLATRVRARLDPEERFGLRLFLLAVTVVLLAVPFNALLFQVLGDGSLTRFDARVADAANDLVVDHPALVTALDAVSWLGRPPVLAALLAIASAVAWRQGRHRTAVFLVVTPAVGGLVGLMVKLAVGRPRPVVDHEVASAWGSSFPSNHALGATVAYGALVVAFLPLIDVGARRSVIVGAVALVLAIGMSRVLLGVHFVSDVAGGFVLGLAWLAGATAAFATWRTERSVGRSLSADGPAFP